MRYFWSFFLMALSGLLSRGVDSAYQIVRYDQAGFVRAFSKDLGGPDVATQTFQKARQVLGCGVARGGTSIPSANGNRPIK